MLSSRKGWIPLYQSRFVGEPPTFQMPWTDWALDPGGSPERQQVLSMTAGLYGFSRLK